VKVVVLADERLPRTRRLTTTLAEGGFEVETTPHPRDAHLVASARAADAIVFEPERVDPDFLRPATGRPSCAHVAWTAGSSSIRAARLLDEGADEVLDDGMSGEEILARLRKAVGRTMGSGAGVLELGPLRIDLAHGEVVWAEKDIRLSKREREVLHALAESSGRTVRREVLYKRVWGYTMARGDRTVDVNVKRLRTKLAAAGAAVIIETRPSVGYRIDVVTDEPAPRSRIPAPAAVAPPEA
jgi:DNA-binding response OmpR family regulator